MEEFNQNTKSEDFNSYEYQKLMQEIKKSLEQKYPKALKTGITGDLKILELEEVQKLMANQNPTQNSSPSKGRGGNNVAQNMKKSVLSIIRKRLSAANFAEYEQRYIKAYELKSQKENYILYFLFLHEFLFQRKINQHTLQCIKSDIVSRVQKYIRNSQNRMEDEPQRSEFHQKNLVQFRKFLQIDLDFSRPRQYSQIRLWIKGQYLKKQAVYSQAQKKVRKILDKHPLLSRIFTDLHVQVKTETMSSNQENMSSSENQVKEQINESS